MVVVRVLWVVVEVSSAGLLQADSVVRGGGQGEVEGVPGFGREIEGGGEFGHVCWRRERDVRWADL